MHHRVAVRTEGHHLRLGVGSVSGRHSRNSELVMHVDVALSQRSEGSLEIKTTHPAVVPMVLEAPNTVGAISFVSD